MFVQGIYRDSSYVYAVVGDYTKNHNMLNKYTVSGSLVGGTGLAGPYCSYGDADHSTLGSGYFAAIYGKSSVRDINLATGSLVSSWSPLADMYGYAYIPGGAYKYVLAEGRTVYRFTVTGSLVSSFAVGWGKSLAASDRFAGRSGEFVIVAADGAVKVYSGGGSLVRTFAVSRPPYFRHDTAVCGPGYPAECNTTLWAHLTDRMPPWDRDCVYQVSLGNGVAVAPASVGRIKALFR
ncbi:MAG: hypothetical protein V3W11_10330 [bacterium]